VYRSCNDGTDTCSALRSVSRRKKHFSIVYEYDSQNIGNPLSVSCSWTGRCFQRLYATQFSVLVKFEGNYSPIDRGSWYESKQIIEHIASLNDGHYIAFSRIRPKWWLLDD
jgi:hypothetical protein